MSDAQHVYWTQRPSTVQGESTRTAGVAIDKRASGAQAGCVEQEKNSCLLRTYSKGKPGPLILRKLRFSKLRFFRCGETPIPRCFSNSLRQRQDILNPGQAGLLNGSISMVQ
jgi:hypothetical protein